jgi:hypothetical protein
MDAPPAKMATEPVQLPVMATHVYDLLAGQNYVLKAEKSGTNILVLSGPLVGSIRKGEKREPVPNTSTVLRLAQGEALEVSPTTFTYLTRAIF